jgi:glycosyltransferase involved in cell wall biosynthesis
VICRLIECLAAKVSFTLVLPENADTESVRRLFTEDTRLDIQITCIPGGIWRNRLAWLLGRSNLCSYIGAQDIYLSGWQWPLGSRDRPFVGIIHDLRMLEPDWVDAQVGFSRRIMWRLLLRRATAICVRASAAVVTPSVYTMDAIDRLGFHIKGKRRVIPNGIELSAWQRPCQLAEDSPYLLAIGQHTPHKNLHRVIAAFAHAAKMGLPEECRLRIVGGFNQETDQLKQLIVQLNLSARVDLLGSVSDQRLHDLMCGAAMLVFPSLVEGFGVPVIEAFATETPVICSNTTSLKEVGSEAALLVDPEDVEDIASAIHSLWNDEALKQDLIQKGKARAECFTDERMAAAYLELFYEVSVSR